MCCRGEAEESCCLYVERSLIWSRAKSEAGPGTQMLNVHDVDSTWLNLCRTKLEEPRQRMTAEG